MSDYVLWRTDLGPRDCILTRLQNVPDRYDLWQGAPCAGEWPSGAFLAMDPDFPNDTVLPDNVKSMEPLPVVSTRVKEIVERMRPPRVEYLPVAIHNHQGEAQASYWILHPTGTEDVIDIEASDVMWNRIQKDRLASIYTLVLDESRITPDLLLFRATHDPHDVFVHRFLAEALLASGASGLRFPQIDEEYDG